MALTEAAVREALKNVIDPELGVSIIDLGLVYSISIDVNVVNIEMTLTSPMCPVGPMIIEDVRAKLAELGAGIINITLVWEPMWSVDKVSDEVKLQLGLL